MFYEVFMINTNSKLTDFQKKVFSEYKTVQALNESSNLINKSRETNKKGCLSVPFFMFADFLVGKAVRGERHKRNYAGNEQEARELLRQKEISDRICQMIGKISRNEILTEEKFVNELTAALYRSDLANQFVIPENALLYALMATEVYNIGLENFCNGKKGNE